MPDQTYQQVRDVVARIRRAHQRLRDQLEELRLDAIDPETQLMLETLRREEQELQVELGKHLADGAEPPLDTWLQYVPDEEVFETLESIEFSPGMTADEVVVAKQTFDQALITLLRQLAEGTAVPRVQEFFGGLRAELERRISRESWGVVDLQGDTETRRSRD